MTPSNFVVVHTASSFHSAQILAGLLESEGIPAKVPGAGLTDEFGMSQKLAGTADVVVTRDHLERAADIVAAWKERENGPGSE